MSNASTIPLEAVNFEPTQIEAQLLARRAPIPSAQVGQAMVGWLDSFIPQMLAMEEAFVPIYSRSGHSNLHYGTNSHYAKETLFTIRRTIKVAEIANKSLDLDLWTPLRNVFYRIEVSNLFENQSDSDEFCMRLSATFGLCRRDFKFLASSSGQFLGDCYFEYIGTQDVSARKRRIDGCVDLLQDIPNMPEYSIRIGAEVRWVLVIEILAVIPFLMNYNLLTNHATIGKGILITGCGVPNYDAREVTNQICFYRPDVVILGMSDGDPYGYGILEQIYKLGSSRAPRAELEHLVVPHMDFGGLCATHVAELGLQEMGERLSERDLGRLGKLLEDERLSETARRELEEILTLQRKYKLDMILRLPDGHIILGDYCVQAISHALRFLADNPREAQAPIPHLPRTPFVQQPTNRTEQSLICSDLLARLKAHCGIIFLSTPVGVAGGYLQVWHDRQLWFEEGRGGEQVLMVRRTYFDLNELRYAQTGDVRVITPEHMSEMLSLQGADASLLASVLGIVQSHTEDGLAWVMDRIPDAVLEAFQHLDAFLGDYGQFRQTAGPMTNNDLTVNFRSVAIRFEFFRAVTSRNFVRKNLACDYCKNVFQKHYNLCVHIIGTHLKRIEQVINNPATAVY